MIGDLYTQIAELQEEIKELQDSNINLERLIRQKDIHIACCHGQIEELQKLAFPGRKE